MTQPSEGQQSTPLLARRVGPFSVLVWFILFVGLIALILWWRRTNKGNANTGSSSVNLAGGVTQQAPTMVPYTSDIFVTVQNPVPGGSDQPQQPGTQPPANQPPNNTPPPPPRKTSVTYPIVSGDTLVDIGRKFGLPWQVIYEANKATIEARAKQQGFASSQGGHWIFPGTTLMIPV